MKKTLILILTTAFLLNGCLLKEQGDALIESATTSYNNIKEETQDVVNKAQEAKDKIDETVYEVENAIDKVSEAKAALDAITQ